MRSAEHQILREFLAADDAFISGSRLGKLLDTSRVSVWNHMETLRAEGYEFEGRPRRGYRLTKIPDILSPAYLNASLAGTGSELPVFFHETIDSTNSEADRLLAQGQSAPFLVAARAQTQGRGRLGRQWHSRDPGNLYLTFAFAPGLPPAKMQTFTLWMGIALCRFLAEEIPGVRIKWPNDLLVDGKKLAGMLTEARVDADRIRDLVFGLGINVNDSGKNWANGMENIATSIATIRGSPIPLNPFAATLVKRIIEAYDRFIHGIPTDLLQEEWRRFDALAGLPVSAAVNSRPVGGVVEGIDADGRLLVRTASGEIIRLSAGDVTLNKTSPFISPGHSLPSAPGNPE